MSEERIAQIEQSVAEQPISPRFTQPVASPAGDTALSFLDKEFSKIEEYISLKLADSRYKSLILTQLEVVYAIIRTLVAKEVS